MATKRSILCLLLLIVVGSLSNASPLEEEKCYPALRDAHLAAIAFNLPPSKRNPGPSPAKEGSLAFVEAPGADEEASLALAASGLPHVSLVLHTLADKPVAKNIDSSAQSSLRLVLFRTCISRNAP